MGFGISLILIAAGAILAWAVSVHTSGVDVNTIGVILLVIGIGVMTIVLADPPAIAQTDQSAQDHAVGFGQPRFQLAEDVELRSRQFPPSHQSIGKGGLEHLGII